MKKLEIICGVRIHNLKVLSEYFHPLCDGRKTFEIRNNDRGFKVGDVLSMHLWSAKAGYLKAIAPVMRMVTYITDYEQRPEFVVLALSSCLDRREIPGFMDVRRPRRP